MNSKRKIEQDTRSRDPDGDETDDGSVDERLLLAAQTRKTMEAEKSNQNQSTGYFGNDTASQGGEERPQKKVNLLMNHGY